MYQSQILSNKATYGSSIYSTNKPSGSLPELNEESDEASDKVDVIQEGAPSDLLINDRLIDEMRCKH